MHARTTSRGGRVAPGGVAVVGVLSAMITATVVAGDLSGFVESEVRWFPQSPQFVDQADSALAVSLAVQPEWFHEWEDTGWRLKAAPFLRWDGTDSERTHADLREFYVQKRFLENLEVSIGVRRLFWGVAESVHLIDVINQVDLVENIDEEDRLGQPMVQLTYANDAGAIDLLGMPYFRERTFPGSRGRLRREPFVDADRAVFESAAAEWHFDVAVRASTSRGPFDVGIYHFHGTNREPTLLPGPPDASGRPESLVPYYEIVDQTGVDFQFTKGNWLWKLEAFSRSGQGDWFWAGVGGFEYTFFDVSESGIDMGLLAEFLYDDRSAERASVYEDDVFLGTRIALNDSRDTAVLAGAIIDRRFGSVVFNLEASRRISDRWTAYTEWRAFQNVDARDPLAALERDSYVLLALRRYF